MRNQVTRLLVVGASGNIGRRIAAQATPAIPVLALSSRASGPAHLDLLEPERFDYARLGAQDAVVLAAGIASPDECARNPERARALNVEGTAAFIERATQRGARVVFFSSDTVYGESDEEIDESAPCRPAGTYAQMKLEVENRFAAEPLVRTLRLSYVFSSEDPFTRYLSGCAARGAPAEIFHPFYRAVVHRDDAAQAAIAAALHEHAPRTINVGGPQVLSRLDLAQALRAGPLPSLAWRTVEPAADFFLNRPRAIGMRSPHLAALLGRPPHSLAEAIGVEFGTK